MTAANALRASALVAVVLLAGCGGRSSSALPPAVPGNPGAASPASAGRAAVTFSVKVPARPQAVRSVAVAIDAGPNQLNAALNVGLGSTGCTSPAPASPAVCSAVFYATPGEHTFGFAAYDDVLDRGGKPQGTMLSHSGGIPFTVAASAPGAVNVALQGAPAGIAIVPGARQDVQGTQQSGFDVYGVFKADGVTPFDRTITAVATDAAGAFILGPDAPAIAIVSSDPGTFANAVAVPGDANTFTLPAVSYNTKRMEIAVSATPGISSAGASPAQVHVSLRVVARNAPRIYVMDHLTNNTGKVWVFDEEGNQISVAGDFAGLNGGIGISYDARLGRLYVSNEYANAITVYDPEGRTIRTAGAFPNLYFPMGLYADDARGQIYVGNFDGGIDNRNDGGAGAVPCNVPRAGTCGVTVYDEEGRQLAAPGGWREREGVVPYLPYGVLVDGSGRVYVTDAGYNRAEAYDASGHALFSWPTGAGAHGIAHDAATRHLYVADDAACVSRYDRDGAQIPLAAGNCTGRDVAARDGNAFQNVRGPVAVRQNPANGWLYVANYANNSVTAYDREGNQMVLHGKNLNGGPFGFNGSSGVVNGPIGIEVVP
jgi:hypothetical protein